MQNFQNKSIKLFAWQYLPLLSQINLTRKSSCVTARGIPHTHLPHGLLPGSKTNWLGGGVHPYVRVPPSSPLDLASDRYPLHGLDTGQVSPTRLGTGQEPHTGLGTGQEPHTGLGTGQEPHTGFGTGQVPLPMWTDRQSKNKTKQSRSLGKLLWIFDLQLRTEIFHVINFWFSAPVSAIHFNGN